MTGYFRQVTNQNNIKLFTGQKKNNGSPYFVKEIVLQCANIFALLLSKIPVKTFTILIDTLTFAFIPSHIQ